MTAEYPAPTEPGWYWRWKPAGYGFAVLREIVPVRQHADGRLGVYGSGLFQSVEDPRSWWKWGPRVPDWTPES